MVKHPRRYLVLYNLVILVILFWIAAYFSYTFPDMFDSLFDLHKKLSWQSEVLTGIWFAILGAVAINLKGINDHRGESNKSFHKWDLWYLDRPVSGIIVGVMSYILLQAANFNSPPSVLALAVVAFIFGMQEKQFMQFLYKISDLILNAPQGKKS